MLVPSAVLLVWTERVQDDGWVGERRLLGGENASAVASSRKRDDRDFILLFGWQTETRVSPSRRRKPSTRILSLANNATQCNAQRRNSYNIKVNFVIRIE